MQKHFLTMAQYNRWANDRLYSAAAKLPERDYRADLGAFFGSLHRTLNHLVVTDRIWMRRLTGEGTVHTRLDEEPYGSLDALTPARQEEDARIVAYVASLTDADCAAVFTYSRVSSPASVSQSRASALTHLFNHQTHHRGQAHCLLTIAGGRDAAPPLDLIFFQRETGRDLA